MIKCWADDDVTKNERKKQKVKIVLCDSREADYRGLPSCRYNLQRSDKRQMNFFNFSFQFFFSIFLSVNFIVRQTIVDFS